ncbi:AI-2E family transporter [Arthrobacter antibioticus]|uniref:AI-2E family transporter n=1 Tax=Arthrobacter sp. H35-MC1 TaxID=3046203 RepID=UPI0024BB61FB|nr:AI-2E family transporter [Arthrobacter sp. H35-MC1]MDJ0316414.1 AI-2E family transporter [Arthrobacter sp. H35-MC1]
MNRNERSHKTSATELKGARTLAPSMFASSPFRWGFTVTLGVLVALLLAFTISNLTNVLFAVFAALFISLGLDPLVRWFQRKGLSRAMSLLTVILLFILVVVGLVALITPLIVEQSNHLVATLPGQVQAMQTDGWFDDLNKKTNGMAQQALVWVNSLLTDPKIWAQVGGGALAVGVALASGFSTGLFIFILTIYFVATLDTMKKAGYSLIDASKRETVISYAERIMDSIGRYLSGMAVLAAINAVYSFILLTVVGSPYAVIIATLALFVTLIPLVGTVLTTALMTMVALFTSPTAALIVLIAMLVYMQLEAYVFTPKVMSKAVHVPGSIVLISALAGGTLLGLAGALVAIPISAGIILIIREVVIPARAKR